MNTIANSGASTVRIHLDARVQRPQAEACATIFPDPAAQGKARTLNHTDLCLPRRFWRADFSPRGALAPLAGSEAKASRDKLKLVLLQSEAKASRGLKPALHRNPIARIVERTLAGVLFVLTLPLLAVLAVVVAALSRQPPFVAHRRMGQYGSELWVLKIRTMWARHVPKRRWRWIERLAETSVPVVKCRPDPRVTSRFAAFCRRFSLDELPQLLHVAAGQMRFVGPRPITFAEWDAYYGTAMREVLEAPPGLTGLWQVRGRNRLNYAQRRRLDLFYVRRRSAQLDWWIVARTPSKVLSGRDSA